MCVTLLPYLYLTLVLVYGGLFYLARKKVFLGLLVALIVSAGVFWRNVLLPKSIQPASGIEAIRVMVWNVQRLGEFSQRTQVSQIDCVAQMITQVRPDLLALLEITSHQLFALQKRLNIPQNHCLWTDYYGTGQQKFGGLATCVANAAAEWNIYRKRQLHLPPNWKYLFIEVQPPENISASPLNFLALHVAPPLVSKNEVWQIVKKLLRGKVEGFSLLRETLRTYEQQVELQGMQAVEALLHIRNFRDPTVIAGDFNSTRDAALHGELRQTLIDTWSVAGMGFGATRYWGDVLPLRIDYIYTTKDFAVQQTQTPSASCSDHLPVVSSVFLYSTTP